MFGGGDHTEIQLGCSAIPKHGAAKERGTASAPRADGGLRSRLRTHGFRPTEKVNGKLSLGSEIGRSVYCQESATAPGTSMGSVLSPRRRARTKVSPTPDFRRYYGWAPTIHSVPLPIVLDMHGVSAIWGKPMWIKNVFDRLVCRRLNIPVSLANLNLMRDDGRALTYGEVWMEAAGALLPDQECCWLDLFCDQK